MPKHVQRNFSRSFKLEAVQRMLSGANVSALARELDIERCVLKRWRARFLEGGVTALRGKGRQPGTKMAVVQRPKAPPGDLAAARERIAELERKIGRQQVDLDFFRRALRQVEEARRPSAEPGVRGFTRSSKR
jgi:transposase-like protein